MEVIELWLDIEGYESLYQISNLGNVRSLRFGKCKVLKARESSTRAYQGLVLRKGGIRKWYCIHVLVAKAFLPNVDTSKIEVNHKNGNKLDNRATNLEWVTPKENTQHAWSLGLCKSIIDAQVRRIKRFLWFNKNIDKYFEGSVAELIDYYRDMKLNNGKLSNVITGKRTHHKGWTVSNRKETIN